MNDFEKNNFADFTASSAMKDIGFDDAVLAVYKEDGELELGNGTAWYSYKFNPEIVIAPLHQQARKWFRENHGLDVDVTWLSNCFFATVQRFKPNAEPFEHWVRLWEGNFSAEPDAYNAAIIRAAKIVKEKQNR